MHLSTARKAKGKTSHTENKCNFHIFSAHQTGQNSKNHRHRAQGAHSEQTTQIVSTFPCTFAGVPFLCCCFCCSALLSIAGAVLRTKTTLLQQLEQTLRALLVAYEEEKKKTSQKLSKMATLFHQLQEQEEDPADSVAPSHGPASLRSSSASNARAGGGGSGSNGNR